MATFPSSCVLLLALFLSVLIIADHVVVGYQTSQERMSSESRQCRIQRLSSTRPSRRIESEGGVTELWDDNEDQFQCAGVSAMRNFIRPESLSLPNFSPSPRLVYIQKGRGLLGISFPGCPESYHSGQQTSYRGGEGRREQEADSRSDQHQKIHRFQQGDILAIPAGVVHWCYNDGNEELVAVSVNDLNSMSNQLDQTRRSFYLAGGQPKGGRILGFRGRGQETEMRGDNIFRAFDADMIAEAFNIPMDLARRMQREDNRGLIVRAQREHMGMIRPREEEGREERRGQGMAANGMEEALCNMRVNYYLDNPNEADVYSRQAGRLNSVNVQKLPILTSLDMSAEKGNLYPNAMVAPNWAMNSHRIIYITRGDGRLQVVGNQGRTVFDGRVREGEMVVVPQYFAAMKRAGRNGLEWVSFHTTMMPMRSSLAGATSVLRGMPLQVLSESYRISSRQAEELKYNRDSHVALLPPMTSSRPSLMQVLMPLLNV